MMSQWCYQAYLSLGFDSKVLQQKGCVTNEVWHLKDTGVFSSAALIPSNDVSANSVTASTVVVVGLQVVEAISISTFQN